MEKRPFDITIHSAKGLKDVGAFSKMDVYVAVSLSGMHGSEQKTPVDTDGGSSPKWNHGPMRFTLDEPGVQMNKIVVEFKLRHERKVMGDKDVGEVHVGIKDLLEKGKDGKVDYPVKQPNGKVKGSIEFSYNFGDVYKIETPVYDAPQQKMVEPYPQQGPGYYPPPTGYPMQGASGSYGPPPAYGAPYGAPPQGYPQGPPVAGYGYGGYQQPPPGAYPPQGYPGGYQGGYQQHGQKPNKSGGGMGAGAGLGLGLAGGLVGGMIVGEMLDDAFDGDCGDF